MIKRIIRALRRFLGLRPHFGGRDTPEIPNLRHPSISMVDRQKQAEKEIT